MVPGPLRSDVGEDRIGLWRNGQLGQNLARQEFMSTTEGGLQDASSTRQPCWIFDIPFTPLTLDETVSEMKRLILRSVPSVSLITANTNYAMLVAKHPDLNEVNRKAALILADGIHPVWTSRLTPRPLPERVTGIDLLYRFSELAAQKSYSLFLLGGALVWPIRPHVSSAISILDFGSPVPRRRCSGT